MKETRLYDTAGREKILNELKDCKTIADLGCNKEKIRSDAIGYDMDTETLPDYICDFNSADFQFENTYDGICISHLLEHIIDVRTLLKECYEALNPSGKIAMIVPNGETVLPVNLGDSDGTHEMLFTPITLKLYLQNTGFKNVHTEYYDRPYAYKQTKGIFGVGKK